MQEGDRNMINSYEFLGLIKEEDIKVFRLGTIVNGKVKFDGESIASEKIYKRLSSYSVADGDRVLLARISGTYVILGKIV